MKLPFTIQIPVFNETHALNFSFFYFEKLGITPRYVLDSKRTGEAEAALRALGLEAVVFRNDKPFVENGYEQFAAVSPTDWILRLDCDEVPSGELIEFCSEFVRGRSSGIVGFERHQLLWQEGQFFTASADRFKPVQQRQWRLFNRQRVVFDREIHTPGIRVDEPISAPPNAAIYHLSWVFLDWNQRVKKASRYDKFGQPKLNRSNQLFPIEDAKWQLLNDQSLKGSFETWLQTNPLANYQITSLRRKSAPQPVRNFPRFLQNVCDFLK